MDYSTLDDLSNRDFEPADQFDFDAASATQPLDSLGHDYVPVDLLALADVPAAFQAYVEQQCMSCG